jgi:hypothetical protein
MKRIMTTALLLALGLASCGNPLDPAPGMVKRIRVAAIIADKPEAKPGEEITMTAYVIEPMGRQYGVEWFLGQDDKSAAIGTGNQVKWLAPQDEGRYLISVVATDETGNFEPATKAMVVSSNPEPNRNPVLNITAEPAPGASVGPGDRVALKMDYLDPDAEDADNLRPAWLITSGKLSKDDEPEVEWTAPSEPGNYTIYGVVRDMRGGTAFSSVVFAVSE